MYYNFMGGGDACEWSEKMHTSLKKISDKAANFRSFTAPGSVHCILPDKAFYTVQSNGVKLIDWINDMIEGKDVADVHCKDCGKPQKACTSGK